MKDLEAAPIESIIQEFVDNLSKSPSPRKLIQERTILSLPVPAEYKAKYDLIQQKTKKTFNRVLERVVIRAMDMVDVKDLPEDEIAS